MTRRAKVLAPALVSVGLLALVLFGQPSGSLRSLEAHLVESLGVDRSGCRRGCESGYWEFLSRHSAEPGVLTDSELSALLERADSAPMPKPRKLSSADLGRRVRQVLGIDFLLAGLEARPLTVSELDRRSGPGFVERRLLFDDPEVGSFEGLLLLPAAAGPHAAVIGLHGHRDDAETFAEDYLGRKLAGLGFVVLMPTFRLHDCSRAESKIAIELLKNGFTLMGFRVYETLLLANYLAHLEGVDAKRIGLIGHSGGSSVANLAVRVSDVFAAKVTDYQVDYRNRCRRDRVHCETLPALVPLSAQIASEHDLGIPYLKVPYKFQDAASIAAIESFFTTALAPPG